MERTVLIPPGNLDTVGATEFESTVDSVGDGTAVTLDMHKVAFMASSGIRVILKLAKRANLELTNVNPAVHLVFKTSGLDKFLNIK